jgi:hypothetical protein
MIPTDVLSSAFLNEQLRSPERLEQLARDGALPKEALLRLLAPRARRSFLDVCAAIERRYTEACTASGDPCLESGCALEGETCLEPLRRAGTEYNQACAVPWLDLFADPENRVDVVSD